MDFTPGLDGGQPSHRRSFGEWFEVCCRDRWAHANVPGGGDAYILSHIIHDWKEDQCLTILGNCRKAMKPGAKLLIVEFVLPEGNTPHFGKLVDMVMLAIPGGEERTANEYETLLARVDLKMTRVVPTASDVSIVEAELN